MLIAYFFYKIVLCEHWDYFFIVVISNWGVAKLVKAPDFDSGMRGFESFLPSQTFKRNELSEK